MYFDLSRTSYEDQMFEESKSSKKTCICVDKMSKKVRAYIAQEQSSTEILNEGQNLF